MSIFNDVMPGEIISGAAQMTRFDWNTFKSKMRVQNKTTPATAMGQYAFVLSPQKEVYKPATLQGRAFAEQVDEMHKRSAQAALNTQHKTVTTVLSNMETKHSHTRVHNAKVKVKV